MRLTRTSSAPKKHPVSRHCKSHGIAYNPVRLWAIFT
jgi:hypothetical protein